MSKEKRTIKVRTIDDDFEYRIKKILRRLKKEYFDEQEDSNKFEDWLWNNREILGENIFEEISEYFGDINEIELND